MVVTLVEIPRGVVVVVSRPRVGDRVVILVDIPRGVDSVGGPRMVDGVSVTIPPPDVADVVD